MKTLARRSPRVLLVAAVSTTAWVATTAGASAAERCEPLQLGCSDGTADFFGVRTTTEKTTETYTDKVTVIHERTHVVQPVESTGADKSTDDPANASTKESIREESSAAADSAEPECVPAPLRASLERVPGVGSVLDRVSPYVPTTVVSECGSTANVDTVIGPEVTQKSVEVADATPRVTVENDLEVPAVKSDRAVKTTAVAGGVDVDKAEIHDRTAVAPEQHEVSAPADVKVAPLPKTGGNGGVLTMLGLALIASGAVVRTAARD
jgi:LPXTG-motif cell wall-anchored protein